MFAEVPSSVVQDHDVTSVLGRDRGALRPELGLLHAHDGDAHLHVQSTQCGLEECKCYFTIFTISVLFAFPKKYEHLPLSSIENKTKVV